ncbi:MAG: cell division protein FtsA [Candidatus Brocadiia bacterium]
MSSGSEEYLIALDLGSAVTRCAVVCYRPDGGLLLEGYAEYATRGVARGLVVDAQGAAASVRAAVEAAASRARVRVYTVLVSVATPYARGLNSRGCIGIVHEDKVVRGNDARQALAAARRIALPSDRAVAEVYPQGFAVDDVRGVHNPVGLSGGRLEAEVHVVTDALAGHANVEQAARRAGYRLEPVVFGPAAAAHVVLSDEEKDLGGVHADVGADTTSVTLYAGGYPRFTRVLPVGARHITHDLAVGLNTSMEEAEKLKRRYGMVDPRRPRRRAATPTAEVPLGDGSTVRSVPLWRIGVIVRERVDEIFELVGKELDRSGCSAGASCRAVLTGGFCRMKGALAAAQRALRRPVRFARIPMETTLGQFESDETHAVVLGTVHRGVHYREQRLDRRFHEGGLRGLLGRVAGWL